MKNRFVLHLVCAGAWLILHCVASFDCQFPVTTSSGFLLRHCDFLCLLKLVSPKQASVPILVPRSEFPAADCVLDFCAASVRLFLLESFGRWQWVFGSANTSQKPLVQLEFLALNFVGRRSSLAWCWAHGYRNAQSQLQYVNQKGSWWFFFFCLLSLLVPAQWFYFA
jgi:hypothetical protein